MDGATIYRVVFGEDVQPDAWQLALTSDAWPRVLIAPTGSGKTAAVTLGWAAHRLQSPDRTPRRLVWCLPMRTLVEQTARAVEEWFGKLAAEVDGEGRLPRPEDVHVLMGGEDGVGWLEAPERPAVLVGAQWVFDEVQLMGAGRSGDATWTEARRQGRSAGKTSRSVRISAILNPTWLATVDYPTPAPAAVVSIDPSAVPGGRLARLAHVAKRLSCSHRRHRVGDIVPLSYAKPTASIACERESCSG